MRLLRFLIWLFVSFLILFIIISIALQFPSVQTFLTGRITSLISSETGTEISIERVAVRFPKSVGLKGIYVGDTTGDTLIYAGSIYLDIKMTALLRNRIRIGSLEIDNLTAEIKREKPDSVFNFQFITDSFSGDRGKKNQTGEEVSSLDFSLDNIRLTNIRVRFDDHHSGLSLISEINHFTTTMNRSDLLNGKYHAGKTELYGSNIQILEYEPSYPSGQENTEMTYPDVFFNSMDIRDMKFGFRDSKGTDFNLSAGMLNIVPEMIILKDNLINFASITADDLHTSVMSPSGEQNEPDTHAAGSDTLLHINETAFRFSDILQWTVRLGSLDLSNSSFTMLEAGKLPEREHFDPENFSFGNINLSAGNIFAGPDSLDIDIRNFSMTVSERLSLDQLLLDINLGSISGRIRLDLVTGDSKLGLSFRTETNLLDFTLNDLYNKRFDLHFKDSQIREDLAFFLPFMKTYYFNWPGNRGIDFGGSMHGSLAHLIADRLWFAAPGFLTANIRGEVKELLNMDSLYVNMEEISLSAFPDLFFSNLPDSLRPVNFTMPEFIMAEATIKGTKNDFDAALHIDSNFGDIAIAAEMSEGPGPENSFKGRLTAGSFDIGGLLQLDMLAGRPPSILLDFHGRGSDPELMELEAELIIGHLTLREHTYDDIVLHASLKDSVVSLSGNYRDESLAMDISGIAGAFTKTMFAKADIEIDYADLKKLGITENQMLFGTAVKADVSLYPENFFNGDIIISNTNIATDGEVYHISELLIKSASQTDNYLISVTSGFLNAEYSGNFTPLDTPGIIADHISDYFSITDSLPLQDSIFRKFDLTLTLFPDDLIKIVIWPGIEKYDTLSVSAHYDSRMHEITLMASMDDIAISGTDFVKFKAGMISDSQRMDFDLSVDEVGLGETHFYDFNLRGAFIDQELDVSLSVNDVEKENLFAINAGAVTSDELYFISIDSDSLILNRELWSIDPDNIIVAGKDSLNISGFILENGESMFSITSLESESYKNVLDFNFTNFDIKSITGFLENEIPVTGGLINGHFTLRDISYEPTFLADLNIKNISFSSDTIQMISLKAENPEPDNYYISASAEHLGALVWTKGYYISGEEPSLNLDVVMEGFNLSIVESFTGGNITHLGGYINGKMRIGGKPDNPELNGTLQIDEAGFRVPALNAGYFLKKEIINFDSQNIRFQNFTLEDSLGRRAQLNGNVNFANPDNFILNLNLSARNFLLLNLPERRDELYHGRILIDSDLRLRGTHLNPALEGNLKLNEGSSFTFILPQGAPEAIGDEGVVEFIPAGDTLFFQMLADRMETEELVSSVGSMDISLNVEIDSQTELTIIIDDLAGDFLELKGGGVLSLGIDPGGRISLAGRYDITEGAYLLTFYDVIRRNFSIRPGSNIIWTGDPLDAELDITAIYTLRTNARELMRAHTGTGQSQAAILRQQYPFLVYLNMRANLMNPEISFELDLPPEHQSALDGSIMARINEINQNDSELNKQVFALLILGNFIQENPLDFSGGPGLSSTARSSGSQILSQQLNRMSDRYIRGIDVNFELESYEDYTEGQSAGRTELQMEVSRNFFDERMRITVGGNIELEDETRRQTGAGDIAGDFSLEYLLTPEGNLIIRGFRNRDYGDLIEGDVTETGIALTFSRSYNRLKELFRKRDEEPEVPQTDDVDAVTGSEPAVP